MKLPELFDKWNPAMRGAYLKGRAAFEAGQKEQDCSYQDRRKDCGRVTWSRAFMAAWRDGFHDARAEFSESFSEASAAANGDAT